MSKSKKPEVVSLTNEEVQSLKKRVEESSLLASDQKILLGLLSFNFWLQEKLSQAQVTILRLKKIFGLPTEKNNPLASVDQNETNDLVAPDLASSTPQIPAEENATPPTVPAKKKVKFNPEKNHGRYGAKDYPGCAQIYVPLKNLKIGDPCPDCTAAHQRGRLRKVEPALIVQLSGSPLITGTCYELETLRCSLCQKYYKAPLPDEAAKRGKYDETCRSAMAISHYYSGQPFYRTETLQALQGIPVADSTQWLQVEKLYEIVLPVYRVTEKLAANGELVKYDDTGNRILEISPKNKAVHTTAFLSKFDGHCVYLFFTSQYYAGQNMGLLLDERTTDKPLMTMTDASSQNIPKYVDDDLMAKWLLCFCLVHGRRKFHELLGIYTQECKFVLDIFSEVYRHERHCKRQKLNAEERLLYHQKHSAPLLQSLYAWLNNQLLHRVVEENCSLGQAIRYMLRHWQALTQFLRVAGAPIDNSLCEQAIKVAIRYRRNSLFYKTLKGAQVGDCLMSLIHTAAKNKANIFDYLNALQRHAIAVKTDPEEWLPWNYEDTLVRLANTQAA